MHLAHAAAFLCDLQFPARGWSCCTADRVFSGAFRALGLFIQINAFSLGRTLLIQAVGQEDELPRDNGN
jgi:hypothetical protein